jgi:hypothetical protein
MKKINLILTNQRKLVNIKKIHPQFNFNPNLFIQTKSFSEFHRDDIRMNPKISEMIEFQKKLNKETFEALNKQIEERTENKIFKLKSIPDPNHFGEALIYLSPNIHSLNNYNNKLEISTFPFLIGLSFINSLGVFGSGYLHYFIYGLLLNSLFRINYTKFMKTVYQINLINESTVRFVFLNGDSKVVKIKNVKIHDLNYVQNLEVQLKKDITLYVDGLTVLLSICTVNRFCLLDKELLFAIINKNVESLELEI